MPISAGKGRWEAGSGKALVLRTDGLGEPTCLHLWVGDGRGKEGRGYVYLGDIPFRQYVGSSRDEKTN